MTVIIQWLEINSAQAVNCTTRVSNISNSTASIGCNADNPTLVSCGFETLEIDDETVHGNEFDSGLMECQAMAGDSDVRAHARCCSFPTPSPVSCSIYTPSDPNDADGNCVSDATNPTHDILLGCSFTYSSGANNALGVYPFSDTSDFIGQSNPRDDTSICSAATGIPLLNCCNIDRADLQCNYYYVSSTTELEQRIGCPDSDQFMTSCSGFVDDNGNDNANLKYVSSHIRTSARIYDIYIYIYIALNTLICRQINVMLECAHKEFSQLLSMLLQNGMFILHFFCPFNW